MVGRVLEKGQAVLHVRDYGRQLEETVVEEWSRWEKVLASGESVHMHDVVVPLDDPVLVEARADYVRYVTVTVLEHSYSILSDAVKAKIDEITALLTEQEVSSVLRVLKGCGALSSEAEFVSRALR